MNPLAFPPSCCDHMIWSVSAFLNSHDTLRSQKIPQEQEREQHSHDSVDFQRTISVIFKRSRPSQYHQTISNQPQQLFQLTAIFTVGKNKTF